MAAGATHLAGKESQILAQLTMEYYFTDTDFFHQSESAADFRGRLNWPSTFYQFFYSFLAPDCSYMKFLSVFNGF